MKTPLPVVLEARGVRLEPLDRTHQDEIAAAASDGKLWELWYTSIPRPEETGRFIEMALAGQDQGHMLPWVVRDVASGALIGTTRYHDIVAAAGRVEIGWTFYAARWQRTHVNTTCKLMLFEHAFETLECRVVGLRTDNFNFRSQRAIEALGAKRDGILRCFQARRDGTPRDTYMYSVVASEWPDVKRHLKFRLERHSQ